MCTIRKSEAIKTNKTNIEGMRNMWKRIVAAGIVLAIGLGCYFCYQAVGENVQIGNDADTDKTTQNIFAMDTYMEVTAYGANSKYAVEQAVSEIERLDALLSTGKGKSEVTQLNKKKESVLSEDYEYLLKRSMELYESTQGLFDITIYPLMRAWGFTNQEYRVPEQEEIDALLEHVDASKLYYEESIGMLQLPQEVEIDFGGIAKGYTSMCVTQLMREAGVESGIVNLGGNVQTIGKKTDGSNWKIAIKSPYEDIPYLGVISIAEAAVITSGGYERYFEEAGEVYHHIIDTRTGRPAQSGLISVTIVCEDGTLADGLSTALYVMGKNEAIRYWREHRHEFDFVLCDESGKLYVSEGIKERFTTELPYEIIE